MEQTGLIPATEFCTIYHIPGSFISNLSEAGLIEVVSIDEQYFLYPDQVGELEKLVRFHTEMDINIEGIEAIAHLLQQVQSLQDEVRALRHRLSMYEDDPG